MLDRLLGRQDLKKRIAELEAERDRLREQLASAKESRAEAVSDRQDAEREVNRLEDRVAELEDRVQRLQGEEPDLSYRRVEAVSGARAREVYDRLAAVGTEPEGALTAMVVNGKLPGAVREAFGEHAALVARASPCLALADDAGMVSAAVTLPVEPEPFATWDAGFRLEREWMLPTGEFGFALVRSDLFAVGVYEGRDRVEMEGFESDVRADHSKGGYSQARFERRRDQQISDHLDRVEDALADLTVDRLYLAGDRTVLSDLRDRAVATQPVDASGDPETALDRAFEEFWTARVYGI